MKTPRWAAAPLVAVLLLSACSTLTQTSQACDLSDGELFDLQNEWNWVSGELLTSYMKASAAPADREPGAVAQYVIDSDRLIPKLTRIVQDLRNLRGCLPANQRDVFEPVLGTYNDKLLGYVALGNAVRLNSTEGEEAAKVMLTSAAREANSLACEIARITGDPLPVDIC